ncbi:DUF5329 domain-containing protein [Pseudomonas sp. CM25]|uniref:DUF5329 domain-containing protein n=1 Tax=Pseudomonas sp. CM25 TaxID=2738448 RepID=UPI0015536D7A|nr:DUF5329 domain-containing protein [Pseudomonas sp. CM25]NQD59359.1 DUF5329 domain-containing protein [Pseudomonas sp. CM25]
MRKWMKGPRRVVSQLITAVSICVIAITVDMRVFALPQTADEIKGLLEFVEKSGCRFIRNGADYSGPRARAHLEQKLNYLESKNMVKSAEDFIDLAATKSSVSGRAYEVRCSGDVEPASVWLHRELQKQREDR